MVPSSSRGAAPLPSAGLGWSEDGASTDPRAAFCWSCGRTVPMWTLHAARRSAQRATRAFPGGYVVVAAPIPALSDPYPMPMTATMRDAKRGFAVSVMLITGAFSGVEVLDAWRPGYLCQQCRRRLSRTRAGTPRLIRKWRDHTRGPCCPRTMLGVAGNPWPIDNAVRTFSPPVACRARTLTALARQCGSYLQPPGPRCLKVRPE